MLADLDSLVAAAMAEWKIPGLAIAVVQDDAPVYVKAFGRRDIQAEPPVTTDTRFLLCSITKSFTAAGLAMLADERRLDWRKPVRDYLPEFRLHDPVAADRTTTIDLLCHLTGLPGHDWLWMPADFPPDRLLAALRHLAPSRDFRQAFQYQNLGYLVAGMVAERITGATWEDITRDRIAAPLGMRQCGFSAQALEQAPDAAQPHYYDIDDDESRRSAAYPISAAPAGGISASIADMVPYLRFHLGGGALGDRRLLSPESARLMQSPLAYVARSEFAELGEQHYGLGLACYAYRGERAVAHDGGWIGWGTRMDMLPDRGIGVAVLTNRSGSPVTNILCHAVFDALCGKAPVPWFERFRDRKQAVLSQHRDSRHAHAAARRPGPPSHELAEYEGEYDHPAYGRMSVGLQEGRLYWRYRGLAAPLSHRHYDVFEVPDRPGVLAPEHLAITFGYDRDGTIDRLSAPLEPAVDALVFRRLPQGEALDPAFRASCAGTYRNGAQTLVVALDADGALTLSPSDQPTCRLVPYQGRVFSIASLHGFRVEFPPGGGQSIESIVLHQPNGTFRGQRIAPA